jgi:hypothetical protein
MVFYCLCHIGFNTDVFLCVNPSHFTELHSVCRHRKLIPCCLALIVTTSFISEVMTHDFVYKTHQAECEGCDTNRIETGLKLNALNVVRSYTTVCSSSTRVRECAYLDGILERNCVMEFLAFFSELCFQQRIGIFFLLFSFLQIPGIKSCC